MKKRSAPRSCLSRSRRSPPAGVAMYTVCSLSGVPVGVFLKDSRPFLIALILVVVLLAAVPELSLFLPDLLMK